MKLTACALTLVLLAGCATGPVVHIQRDPAADFAHYRTYAWTQHPQVSDLRLRSRLVAAIDAELAAKGWAPVTERDADIVLVGNVSSREDASINYVYEGSVWDGRTWRGPGLGGVQRIELRALLVGTLVLDAFDATTHRAIWRGLAQGYVPDAEARRNRDAMAAVRRMFRAFPEAGSGRR